MFEMSTFSWIAIFAIAAAAVNSIGILVVLKKKTWTEKVKAYFMCFAAGLLIASPLMFAFPQASSKNPYAGFAAVGGFLFMFFSNQIIQSRTKQKNLAFGITAIEGIGIHSFVDGIIYTITFSVSIFIGIVSVIGLVIHEFAEGVITFSVLVKGGLSRRKAARYALLVAGLTTPIGAFLAYPFVSTMNETMLGLLLGFVSGVLIYISAAHLLPEAREYEKEHSTWAFIGGVLLALSMVLIKLL